MSHPSRALRHLSAAAVLLILPWARGLAADLDPIIAEAVSRITQLQEPDGSWPYEGVYRVAGQIPIGYRVGGTAIVCQMLLYSDQRQGRAESALARGVDFILKGLSHPDMQPSTRDTYDVRIWGQSYALELFCRLGDSDHPLSLSRSRRVRAWIPRLTEAIISQELPGGGWNYAHRRLPASFVTAPVTQALLWADARGAPVPDEPLIRAREALRAARHPDGAFEYAGKKGDADTPERSLLPGSAARSAICESTLYLLGAGSIENIGAAVQAFHDHWRELEKRRAKPGTHAPPYGIAPYYFYFGHYYTAQALELLPEGSREHERKRMREVILRTRDPDGTWNDRVFDHSRAYGTAMAVMALLADRIPPPPLWDSAFAPLPEKVIQRYLDAIGGDAARRSINTLMARGIRIDRVNRKSGDPVPWTLYRKRGRGYRVEMTTPDRTLIWVVTSRAAWQYDSRDGKTRSIHLAAPPREIMAFYLDIEGPFLDFEKKGIQFDDIARETVGGRAFHHLEMDLGSGEILDVYFDVDTGLLTERRSGDRSIAYSDYRRVGKLLMPHRLVSIRPGGEPSSTDITEEVILNPDLPDHLFTRPKGEKR